MDAVYAIRPPRSSAKRAPLTAFVRDCIPKSGRDNRRIAAAPWRPITEQVGPSTAHGIGPVRAPLDIAVIGAGIAGLASAILFARQGHRVTVYERFAESRPLGSGLMIQPTGMAALARLGLRDELAALGHKIERLMGRTVGGRVVFDLSYGDLQPGLHALAVHRAALHGVLWRAFAACGASLETGCTIAGAAPAGGGRAAPLAETGRHCAAADVIVDASGTHSPLRAQLGVRPATSFSYGAVWATVPDIGVAPAALAQRYVAARVMIGYLPIGRREAGGAALAAFFWSLKPETHAAWRAGFAAWRDEVAALWPALEPVLGGFRGPDDLTLASYQHFTATAPARGRVVLIGDAAHATSPQLGQGANQGLIDAVVLADALARAPDVATAFALYARHRRRHVRFYQRASAVMTPFFQSDSTLLAAVRDLVFDRMKIVPYLRREMVRTLAGLKTGLFTAGVPDALVNDLALRPGADG